MTSAVWSVAVGLLLLFVWHLQPVEATSEGSKGENCSDGSASDFPGDIFTEYQRERGAIILHFIFSVYCFTLIALVCNDYFLPSVDCICTDLNMTQDVAGATFMAIATSTPELFINIIGTFITETDLGVGTVVGSAVFNTLGVATCAGLAARELIDLEWWPLSRDCSIYIVTIGVMTAVTYDGRVDWFEALILLLLYILYFCIMWANGRLMKWAKKLVAKFTDNKTALTSSESSLSEISSDVGPGIYRWCLHEDVDTKETKDEKPTQDSDSVDTSVSKKSRLTCTYEGGILKGIWRLFIWPVALILFLTIPDCRKDNLRRLYPLTFIMCVVWIGSSSYLLAWMMSIIGQTFEIPDSVMGLTLLAAGGSLPEAFSSIIMARKGVGSMGISNSVGANTLDILLCLGLPWFIKSVMAIIETGDLNAGYVQIVSEGVTYSCVALIVCVTLLYIVISLFHFRLGRKLGFTCLTMYLLFITFATLLEMNVFGNVNPPLC